jgi:glycosyltransferase involved in cell wall biosynthesis
MKISIITVCLNAQETISETLYSVASQTYKDVEHIIVDGNSSDNTLEIVHYFERENLKVVSEPDSGIYEAMNKGISLATGDYVFFLNANDKLIHNRVLEIIADKGLSLGKDLVFGTYFEQCHKTGKYGIKKQNNINKFDLWQSCPLQPTLFYKKELFERFGLFNTDYKICGDYDWAIRVLTKEKLDICYIDTLVNLFDSSGISSERNILHEAEKKQITDLYFSKFEMMLFKFLDTHQGRKLVRTNFFGKLFGIPSLK